MADKLKDARRSLIRAKEAANQRLQELENERKELRASLKSLDAALKAITKSERSPGAKTERNRQNGMDLLVPDEADQGLVDDRG